MGRGSRSYGHCFVLVAVGISQLPTLLLTRLDPLGAPPYDPIAMQNASRSAAMRVQQGTPHELGLPKIVILATQPCTEEELEAALDQERIHLKLANVTHPEQSSELRDLLKIGKLTIATLSGGTHTGMDAVAPPRPEETAEWLGKEFNNMVRTKP